MERSQYKVIAIGASFGGINALKKLLPELSERTSTPIVVVLHINVLNDKGLIKLFRTLCKKKVLEAKEREQIEDNHIYFAPPEYHLLIDEQKVFSLSCDNKVSYSRPSIDVFFESMAMAFDHASVAILLTGANEDGAKGLKKIHDFGGVTIAEDPNTAEAPVMPKAAIDLNGVDYIEDLENIADRIISIIKKEDNL